MAFAILHLELEKRLAARQLVVIDATNVETAARHALLARASAAGMPAVAIVLALPAAVVSARNAGRIGRIVDQVVVDRHLRRVATALGTRQLDREGFDAIHILASAAEVDALRIARVPCADLRA